MILKSLLGCRRNSFVTESDIIFIRQLYRCFIFLVVLTIKLFYEENKFNQIFCCSEALPKRRRLLNIERDLRSRDRLKHCLM